MTKQEFEQRIGAQISRQDYNVVEKVYMWHPSIPNAGGKDKIAELYKLGGMTLMQDMFARAQQIEQKDSDLRREYATLREKRDEIRAESQKLGEQITELFEKRKQLYREDEEIITRMNEIQAELQNIA